MNNQQQNDEEKIKRYGSTSVTSVSVSPHFRKLISEYNISPSEAFRRGIAVTLFDLGIEPYQSKKNEERFKFVQKYLKALEEDEELDRQFNEFKKFDKIKNSINELKKVIEIFDSESK